MVKRGLEVFVLGRYMVHFGLKAVGRLGFPRISGSGECSPAILSLSLSRLHSAAGARAKLWRNQKV